MSRSAGGGWGGAPAPPATRGRRATGGGDRGSATAELAVGLPVVVLLLLAGLTAVGAVTTRMECVNAAREAALAASRGEPGAQAGHRAAPPGAEVAVSVEGDTVVVTVRAPVPLLGARLAAISVDATAVAASEPGSPESLP